MKDFGTRIKKERTTKSGQECLVKMYCTGKMRVKDIVDIITVLKTQFIAG